MDNGKIPGGMGVTGNLVASALVSGGATAGIRYLGPLTGLKLDSDEWNALAAVAFLAVGLVMILLFHGTRALVVSVLRRLSFTRAKGDRLAIVVAALANDDEDKIRERVLLSLRSDLKDGVEIIPADECIALGTHGSLDERERAAQSAGQALLNRCDADLLIWGSKVRDENVADLNFLARQLTTEPGTTRSYKLSDTLRLPADFGKDLGTAIVAVAVTAVQPAFDDGHYVANLLLPVVRRLGSVVRSLPQSLAADSKSKILYHYALACRIVGDQHGDNSYLSYATSAYRGALELRPRASGAMGWAETQNSLGNALRSLGQRETGTARLEEAVTAYREALQEYTRERVPLKWAMTQSNLGNALTDLGDRESGIARLEEGATAYREALKEYTREREPLEWANTQNNLGAALRSLGERKSGTARLEEAVAAYREALKERTHERVPLDWAVTQNNLGNALAILGERENGTARLEEAAAAYREALKERTRERVPLKWAATQNNLGNVLRSLGERESGTARLEEAVAALRKALEERTRERVPLEWATTLNNLGNALARLGERESGTARLEEAATAYREALRERIRERVPLDWAMTQNNLGNALTSLGERESGIARLEEAAAAYREALKEYREDNAPYFHKHALRNLARTEDLITIRRAEKP